MLTHPEFQPFQCDLCPKKVSEAGIFGCPHENAQ